LQTICGGTHFPFGSGSRQPPLRQKNGCFHAIEHESRSDDCLAARPTVRLPRAQNGAAYSVGTMSLLPK